MRNIKIKKLFFVVLFLMIPLQIHAADWDTLKVDSLVKPKTGFIADPLRLEIVIDHDKDITLYYPEETFDMRPFEITRIEVVEGDLNTNISRTRINYIFTTYNVLGELTIPPIQVVAKDSSGVKKNITIANHKITIKKIIQDEKAELVDIYSPLEPEKGFPLKLYGYVTAGLLVWAALLFLILKWVRGSSRDKGGRPLSPRDKALEALNHLALEKPEKKLFYFRLSGIFRTFLEEHLLIPALKRTSAEILSDFRKNKSLNGNQNEAGDLFFDLDLVKFSRFEPSKDQMGKAAQRTIDLIRKIP